MNLTGALLGIRPGAETVFFYLVFRGGHVNFHVFQLRLDHSEFQWVQTSHCGAMNALDIINEKYSIRFWVLNSRFSSHIDGFLGP